MLYQAPPHLFYTQDSLFLPSFSHTQKKSETELVVKWEEERAHFLQKSVVLAVQRRKKGNSLKKVDEKASLGPHSLGWLKASIHRPSWGLAVPGG